MRGSRFVFGVVVAQALLSSCADGPGSGPRPDSPPPTTYEDDSDQPVRLAYVCGNRFIVTNAHSVPITVGYRVLGTEEEGFVTIAAAPTEDPAFSDVLIETRQRGTVEISLEGRPVRARENGEVPCSPATPGPALVAGASADVGAWSAPFDWPVVAVHMHLLPNGQVLSWGKVGQPQVWNPATNTFTPSPSPDWLFCSGHSFLADGRLHVAGGHIDDDHGLPDVNLYGSSSGWSSAAPMRRGRWYPTNTTMANGQVVILGGRDEAGMNVPLPEVWTSGTLQQLTGASLNLPYYPRAFLAPNGKLFYAGEHRTTRYLNITGSGAWTTVGQRRVANREYGSAVMYQRGKILYAGGGRTTNTAEVIDLNLANPTWQWTGSMAYARRQLNLTVLPTGEVLATGGVAGTEFNDLTQPVRAAELWNPASGAWRTLASNTVVRGYHATSLLMPDGRVLNAGSGDGAGLPPERNAEVFSPPYLFRGARPTISSAPTVIRYNRTFRVLTPTASAIAKVSLIRLGSVTHGFDMNQRYESLAYTANATGLTVTLTTRRNTPPGHYMLFILNGAGVPSVAKIVQVR
jgi:hypothetical protein